MLPIHPRTGKYSKSVPGMCFSVKTNRVTKMPYHQSEKRYTKTHTKNNKKATQKAGLEPLTWAYRDDGVGRSTAEPK